MASENARGAATAGVRQPGAASGARLSGAQWRTIVLASLGGALEFYDFIVYAIFAPSIAAAFFPASDPRVGLVLTFSILAGGYLARPFGGMLLGALGDRFGRRGVFVFSLAAISASTVAMGLLPGYAAWGFGATVLMVALRLVQGLCLGGELPCSIVYAVETAPARGGFACRGAVLLRQFRGQPRRPGEPRHQLLHDARGRGIDGLAHRLRHRGAHRARQLRDPAPPPRNRRNSRAFAGSRRARRCATSWAGTACRSSSASAPRPPPRCSTA